MAPLLPPMKKGPAKFLTPEVSKDIKDAFERIAKEGRAPIEEMEALVAKKASAAQRLMEELLAEAEKIGKGIAEQQTRALKDMDLENILKATASYKSLLSSTDKEDQKELRAEVLDATAPMRAGHGKYFVMQAQRAKAVTAAIRDIVKTLEGLAKG